MKNIKWSENEICFLKDNYLILSNSQIATHLNRTKNSVDNKARKLNLRKTKYHYNLKFFNHIDTAEKAYWLGFISADGYVQYLTGDNSNYELGIELNYLDREHLVLFNNSIEGNLPINYRVRKSCFKDDTEVHTVNIRVYSKQLVEDLLSHGIYPCKSYDLSLSKSVSYELMPHYIRGYFDGNGSISIDSSDRQTFSINFTSGSSQFCEELSSVLHSNRIKNYIYQEKEHTYRIYIKGMQNMANFLHYIYCDSKILKLNRKYTKAQALYTQFNYARRLPLHSEMNGFLN